MPRERLKRREVAAVALALAGLGVRGAVAVFADPSTAAVTFETADDWVAPTVTATVLSKTTGYLAGSVRQGGTYRLYANVDNSGGSPPSALSSVTADASALTTGAAEVTLTAGSFSAEGVSYSHRSGSLTATNPLSGGAKTYATSAVDAASNARTQTAWPATVDNTAPSASNVQTTNAATNGRAEAGDTVTFTFSEAIDPESVLTGWTGASTAVVLRLIDGGCVIILCSDDSFQVWNAANSTVLPLGTVDLKRSDYHGVLIGTSPPITFGATGTASAMVRSGATVTITLGTASATADTAGGTGAMVWSPTATPYDAAGNTSTTATAAETGGADRDF